MLHEAWLWSLCLHVVYISATLWEPGQHPMGEDDHA